ncbi:MarR family transcriptional regulator [Rhizobium sp. TRM95111]|uniref:MarR family winged helix-turn-helix transcriptional regulator n=1 Tax=Rhizobium alarense TaxID=2846851 RepID=UPI001F3C1DE9|nr:MarR family transcriptional regulator [Rhizobium alarense]MCF3638545.1 MarR family transcriptional regulator [Rhizobium alarense]
MADERDRPEAMTDDMLALGRQLCFAVYSAAHAFNRSYKPLLDPHGLTYPQYLVMLSLWQGDGKTVKALGDELGLDSGTLSPLLRRLEQNGYILRARDRSDERQVLATLTERGRDLKREAAGIQRGIGEATGCSLETLSALTAELRELAARMNATEI